MFMYPIALDSLTYLTIPTSPKINRPTFRSDPAQFDILISRLSFSLHLDTFSALIIFHVVNEGNGQTFFMQYSSIITTNTHATANNYCEFLCTTKLIITGYYATSDREGELYWKYPAER